jgi:hypothetical protein
VNDLTLSFELAKTIGRERQEEAAKHRLLRQIEVGRPRVLNHLWLHIGELLMTLALALRPR